MSFRNAFAALNRKDADYVPAIVDLLLGGARSAGASDVHLVPGADGLQMSWRIDGVLQSIAEFPRDISSQVVARLKVLSQLLTYRTDVPQEGRLRDDSPERETRLSTFPTMFGEKAVVRLFVSSTRYRRLVDLGLPPEVENSLRRLLDETGGVVLITGSAGSGKTTTLYSALRELVDKSQGGRSLVSLEDPIEVVVPGVAQSHVQSHGEFSMAAALRSLLRQDPEVIMVGEIRDRETAATVFQASLTGHLVLTTFHAGSAAQAIGRLSDMGIEPYQLRSGITAIVSQRLVRRLCDCSVTSDREEDRLGLKVECFQLPQGCEHCAGTGYRGRLLLAEMLVPNLDRLGRAILDRSDATEIERLAIEAGLVPLRQRACQAVEAGLTSPAEVQRILGIQ